jgi:hypothetical protein
MEEGAWQPPGATIAPWPIPEGRGVSARGASVRANLRIQGSALQELSLQGRQERLEGGVLGSQALGQQRPQVLDGSCTLLILMAKSLLRGLASL